MNNLINDPMATKREFQAAVYARQSRGSRTALSSCQAQVDFCRDAAACRGWTVTEVFADEAESSETLDRPAMQRLLKAIETGQVDRLIVDRLDRLTRRLIDLLMLLERFGDHQVELVVVNDANFSNSATSRVMTHIVAAASEFQQNLTRERMADMRAALKRQGKRVAGRVPFGYCADRVTKKLMPHPEQSMVVRDFFELAAKGTRPSDLANLANLNGWKNSNGETGKWTSRWISKLLQNRTYLGEIHNGHATLPGEHAAIINRSVFDAVQSQLISRRTRTAAVGERTAKQNPSSANLLGLLICGECNRPMNTSISHRGSIRYLYYRCRSNAGGRPPCPGVNIGVYPLERLVSGVLGDVDDAESEIPRVFRSYWRGLDEIEQRRSLRKIVRRVVYHHQLGEVTFELTDDFESIATRISSDGEHPGDA